MIKEIEEFPFDQFPWKLMHKDGKDNKDTRKCYFQTEEHRTKHQIVSQFCVFEHSLTLVVLQAPTFLRVSFFLTQKFF